MIAFNNNIFHLTGKDFSYQMMIDEKGVLLHSYYGKRIEEEVSPITEQKDRGFSPNALFFDKRTYSYDSLPLELSTLGMGDFRKPAIAVENEDNSITLNLRYHSHEIFNEAKKSELLPGLYGGGGETLVITLKDDAYCIEVKIYYVLFPSYNAFSRYLEIKNLAEGDKTFHSLSSTSLDLSFGKYDLISFTGRHCFERNFNRSKMDALTLNASSSRGTSSHQINPAFIIAERETTEDTGIAFSLHLVYSGSFNFNISKDQYSSYRVILGMGDENMPYILKKGEMITTPQVIHTFSDKGLNNLSNTISDLFKEHLINKNTLSCKAPVLINNWEATYFDFDGTKLINIARKAKKLGVDLFVLDDGWFGKRNDDKSSLGDWFANEEKLGMSLSSLSDRIHKMGMKFGLWIEPEMISRDSKLYREHPDWLMRTPKQEPVKSRDQYILDITNDEAFSYIKNAICNLLDNVKIDYIKWDMNRSLSDIYSPVNRTKRGNTAHNFVLRLYHLLNIVKTNYSNILLEGCSGGGGRFDAGMLYYTPQIWLSDNTDALNRAEIQYNSSYVYPFSAFGAHVSAVPNHQTYRTIPIETRSAIAFLGTYGLELDPEKISDEDGNFLKTEIKRFKSYSNKLKNSHLYRIEKSQYVTCFLTVEKNRKSALLTAILKEREGNPLPIYVKLKGLDPNYTYSVFDKLYKGSTLMNYGLSLPFENKEYPSISYIMKAVKS